MNSAEYIRTRFSRAHLIEQIMAMVGRSLPEPRRVRDFLEDASTESLVRLHAEVLDANISCLTSALAGDSTAAAEASQNITGATSPHAPVYFAPHPSPMATQAHHDSVSPQDKISSRPVVPIGCGEGVNA